ncbi:MAG: hypothetical protein ISS49_16595 [Anaerolineae bacterium]|nr:hypothetical protein [Anaerolineae bacterium]
MQYPLREAIGDPDLLVGREREFRNFGKWIANIPKMLSKSRVILARRKSGKTALVQRIFNQLWSENGAVIPFYFSIGENEVWYPDFAVDYYRAFASQYISFLERNPELIDKPLSLEKIKEYGLAKSIAPLIDDVDALFRDKEIGFHGAMWKTAYAAPHRYAAVLDTRFLVILDEFQNLARYVYPDRHYQTSPIESMPGSFHSVVESKIAPMLVTGSYVGWLLEISSKYLQAGRLSRFRISPYLTPEAGLQAVYKYAEVYDEPITNETAVQINELCMSDPFFISCVMQSNYEGRDPSLRLGSVQATGSGRRLTTTEGVVNTVNYEITNRESEMSMTWAEYIELTLQRINDRNAKAMLLHLSKHAGRYWSTRELKEELGLELSLDEIKRRLLLMVKSDVIEWGPSDVDFRGLQDGTLNLILRHRFEKEISDFEFVPDFKQDFRAQIEKLEEKKQKLQGMVNNLVGQFAEIQLVNEFRARKRFALSEFFDGVEDDSELNVGDVRSRVSIQRDDGKRMEIDVRAKSSCGRTVLVEVRKRKATMGLKAVEDFQEKVEVYAELFPDETVLPAYLSLGGFTEEAQRFCEERGIGTAEGIEYLLSGG